MGRQQPTGDNRRVLEKCVKGNNSLPQLHSAGADTKSRIKPPHPGWGNISHSNFRPACGSAQGAKRPFQIPQLRIAHQDAQRLPCIIKEAGRGEHPGDFTPGNVVGALTDHPALQVRVKIGEIVRENRTEISNQYAVEIDRTTEQAKACIQF